MLRLTAVLVAALYAGMVIWGEPPANGVEVTRSDAMSSAVPALAAAAVPAVASGEAPRDLSKISEKEALRMALQAGEVREPKRAPAAAEVRREEEPSRLWYVTGSRVNLRAGPSTGSAIVGGVGKGDRAEVLSDPKESWTRIRTEGGTEAWIYSRFLAESPA